jgi:hypothetical protein
MSLLKVSKAPNQTEKSVSGFHLYSYIELTHKYANIRAVKKKSAQIT